MNLLKSLATVSLMTVFSRVLGFVRDAVIAKIFGVSIDVDAFFIAFKLPNLLRRIFAEGAFSQAFAPILAEYKNKRCKDDTILFISNVSGLLTIVLVVVTTLGIFAAPWLVTVVAPGFADTVTTLRLTTYLLRITFPYIFLISLAAWAGAILNTWNYFLVSAFSPVFLNTSMISFALFVSPHFCPPIIALGWAVTVGGLLQLAYHFLFLKKINMLAFPQISFKETGALRVIKQMGPAILGGAVNQLSLIINTIFASFLTSGSVSWVYYADRLMEFPTSVLGVALGTILQPSLSRSFFCGKHDEYCYLINWGLRLSFLLALPSTVVLGMLAKPLIVTLFQYGKFTVHDTIMTQKALATYSIGLIGFIVVKILALGFYSRQDIKTPMKVAIITLIITQLMNMVFIGPFKHAGLSLSSGLGACINAGILYWQLCKKKFFTLQTGYSSFFFRVLTAALIMSIVLISMIHVMPEWSCGTMLYRLLRLLTVITISISTYFITLAMLGLKIKEFNIRV